MPQGVYEGSQKVNVTTTGSNNVLVQVPPQNLYLLGMFVSQASGSPTVKVADGSGNIANTFTPVAGQSYWWPCLINGTLAVTLGATVDCTVFYTAP